MRNITKCRFFAEILNIKAISASLPVALRGGGHNKESHELYASHICYRLHFTKFGLIWFGHASLNNYF